MLADAARTFLNRYGVKPGTRAVVVDGARRRLPRRRSTCTRPASPSPASSTSARGRRARPSRRRARPACPSWRAARWSARRAPCACRRLVGPPRAGHVGPRDRALRPRADVGRLHALRAPVLAVARQAALRRGRSATCRASPPRRSPRPAPARAPGGSPRRSTTARRPGRGAGGEAARHGVRRATTPATAAASRRAAARARPRPRQGLRGLPERRHGQGHRARGARGLPLDRARQALHHDRHGDRPGQDVQHERARHRGGRARPHAARGGADDLPAALHARDLRRLRGRGARRPVRPRAPHADPRLGRAHGARASRTSASGSAPGTSPQAGEDMHAAVAREVRATREVPGLFDASTLGKIEVVGPDAAEFLNRHLHQRWRSSASAAAATG